MWSNPSRSFWPIRPQSRDSTARFTSSKTSTATINASNARFEVVESAPRQRPVLSGCDDDTPSANPIDELHRDRGIEGRASKASPDSSAASTTKFGAHVIGRVNHNSSSSGQVVDPSLQPIQLEAVTVFAGVRITRQESPEAGAFARRRVAEPNREVWVGRVRGSSAVRHELMEQDLRSSRIHDPESSLRRGERVVDDREQPISNAARSVERLEGAKRSCEQGGIRHRR